MKSKVTSVDRGAKALMRRLASSAAVTVGVHEAEGAEPKKDDDGDSGMALIDVAVIHEFGAPEANIPARSFIRDWEDENAAEHMELLRRSGKAVLSGKLASAEQALERVGLRFSADVRQRIRAGLSPDIEDRTKDRKGSSTPLIDTGQLVSGVTYEVKAGT